MSLRLHLIFLLTLPMLITACKTSPSVTAPSGIEPMTIAIQALTTDKRYSYFELSPNGDLSYGGGFNAINRNAKPVTQLNSEQLFQLQTYINQSDLFTAKVSGNQSRSRSETVHHELQLKVGKRKRNIVVNDDRIPAVARVHDMLFEYYAQARYNLPGIGKK